MSLLIPIIDEHADQAIQNEKIANNGQAGATNLSFRRMPSRLMLVLRCVVN